MLSVTLLGTGGVMPLNGRALASAMIACQGRAVLIDCGEGTQVAASKADCSLMRVEALLLTHYHADHVTGIPGLLLTMGLEGRQAPLTIVGGEGLDTLMGAVRVMAPRLPYEIVLMQVQKPVTALELAGFQIEAFELQHGVPCFGYAFSLPRARRFLPERARALNVPVALWNTLQKGQTVRADDRDITPDEVLGEPRRGLRVVYATDTRPVPLLETMARDADLLVCEGMYAGDEKSDHALIAGHMTFAEASCLAARAAPRRVWLTHYSPSLRDPEDALPAAREQFERIECGHDGMAIDLPFDDQDAP